MRQRSSSRPSCCGPGSRTPRSRDSARRLQDWARDAAAAAPGCYNMNEGIQNTHPLLIAPLAFAAGERTRRNSSCQRILSLQPVGPVRGRACRPPAHVGRVIQPAPPDDAEGINNLPARGLLAGPQRFCRNFYSCRGLCGNQSVRRACNDAAVLAPSSGENRHRHAIEQASHRWRGGRRGERAVKFDFHTGRGHLPRKRSDTNSSSRAARADAPAWT